MAKKEYDPNYIVEESIISCSRRSDIPAFLMDWVVDKIKQGYVDVPSPRNVDRKDLIRRVSLNPKIVKAWAWWSKDFGPWIQAYNDNKEIFNSYKAHYFNFTINSPSDLEMGVRPSLEERLKQMKWLIDKFSPLAVTFRTDPIVKYKRSPNDTERLNLDKFEYIISNVSSLGLTEMTFSFVTLYEQTKERMIKRGKIPIEILDEEKIRIAKDLKIICDKYNIIMKSCCQPVVLDIDGIYQANCIDGDKIEQLIGEEMEKPRDWGQRKACRCVRSRDIGGYTGIFRCKHNCDYCYGNTADV